MIKLTTRIVKCVKTIFWMSKTLVQMSLVMMGVHLTLRSGRNCAFEKVRNTKALQ